MRVSSTVDCHSVMLYHVIHDVTREKSHQPHQPSASARNTAAEGRRRITRKQSLLCNLLSRLFFCCCWLAKARPLARQEMENLYTTLRSYIHGSSVSSASSRARFLEIPDVVMGRSVFGLWGAGSRWVFGGSRLASSGWVGGRAKWMDERVGWMAMVGWFFVGVSEGGVGGSGLGRISFDVGLGRKGREW